MDGDCDAVDIRRTVRREEGDGLAEFHWIADPTQRDALTARFEPLLVRVVLAAFDGLFDEVFNP
jgi:hypothetical protein